MGVPRIVNAAGCRAGLPSAVSPQGLRHSHSSHALEHGANLALVRDTAGHADLRVTSAYTLADTRRDFWGLVRVGGRIE